jgi:S1-C subfamily serine protease
VGDVIVKLNGKPVSGIDEFRRMAMQPPPGTGVHLDIIHLGDDSWAYITAGQRPDQMIEPGTGYLGVRLSDVTKEMADKLRIPPRGALVTEILDPAGRYIGLEVGDVIVKFDFYEIERLHDLQRRIAGHTTPGRIAKPVDLYVIRKGKQERLFLQLDHISERWR